MHFEGFSGVGFGVVFLLLTFAALAVGLFLLGLVAFAKLYQRRNGIAAGSSGLTFLGIAVLFEPLYSTIQSYFNSPNQSSLSYDRLGFLIWLPMPFVSLAFECAGVAS